MEWKAIRRIYSAASCVCLVGYLVVVSISDPVAKSANVDALGAVVFALLAVAYAGAGSGGDGGGQ
jgi:hypothetical protein